MARSAYARRYTAVGITLAVLILIGAVASGWWSLQRAANNPLSEDAVLTANRVNVAATIAGRVVTIAVTSLHQRSCSPVWPRCTTSASSSFWASCS